MRPHLRAGRCGTPGQGAVGLVRASGSAPAAERILLADKGAAAKFGTSSPIEDPVREQQVLDQAAALAAEAGLDTAGTVAFFRAQIEMSKLVQRSLFERWTAHPEQAPTERPDLATEVRPELDRITVEFSGQLVATGDLRGAGARCHPRAPGRGDLTAHAALFSAVRSGDGDGCGRGVRVVRSMGAVIAATTQKTSGSRNA